MTKTGDKDLFRLFNEIGIINQLASAAFRRVLPPGLNQSMFGVLNHFMRLGDGKTPSELARAFQVTRPSMTATIEKMSRQGLVNVQTDEKDARSKRVYLTAGGRAAHGEAVAAIGSLTGKLPPEFGALPIADMADQLGKLRALLDTERNERDGFS